MNESAPLRHSKALNHQDYNKCKFRMAHSQPALQKYVFFCPVFCSVRSSPTRWTHPLTPHRFGPSHSLPSYQRPCSHKSRCQILCTAFCFPGFAFNNRGYCYPPHCWHLAQNSIYLYRCSGRGLEEGMHDSPLFIIHPG